MTCRACIAALAALIIAGVAIGVVGSGAGDAEARPRILDRAEASALLSGNTVFGFDPRTESEFTVFYSGNGRARAELRNVNGRTDRSNGSWWITDEGKLCIDWENYRWISLCARIVREADSLTFIDDNRRIISFGEVAVGNPDDL